MIIAFDSFYVRFVKGVMLSGYDIEYQILKINWKLEQLKQLKQFSLNSYWRSEILNNGANINDPNKFQPSERLVFNPVMTDRQVWVTCKPVSFCQY